MKKCIFGLLAVFLMAVTVQAQDAKGLAKDSERALGKFNLDQSANKAELTNAIQFGDQAVEADPNMARAWNARGQAYAAVATQIVTDRQLGMGLTEGLPDVSMPAVRAYKSFSKALETAEKRRETKDAVKGLQELMGNLSNKGIFHFEDQEYGKSYACFDALLGAHEKLTELGEESGLKEEDYNRQLYLTGLAALNANNIEAAETLFQQLYEMKYDDAAIYEALYQIRAEKTSPEEAYSILEEGKERYPDDISLLFAEINHYLKLGQSEKLIGKLERAIEAEPENATLYSVMGNAYETLYQKAAERNAGFSGWTKSITSKSQMVPSISAQNQLDKGIVKVTIKVDGSEVASSISEGGYKVAQANIDPLMKGKEVEYIVVCNRCDVTYTTNDGTQQEEVNNSGTESPEFYFNKALSYYDEAQEIDPTNITAIYSAGALYYNRAAQLTQKMLELQDDYSKEGIAKYDAMREQVMSEFDNALPYFKKAEMIAPNDMNTLIALKEIYAKKDDLEMSNVFKERLEILQSGGKNEESYFKNN